jgi:hypothetical protein
MPMAARKTNTAREKIRFIILSSDIPLFRKLQSCAIAWSMAINPSKKIR